MEQERGENHDLFFENYQTNLSDRINDFLGREAFVNVTLVCGGEKIKAHQTILSACSPLFESILIDTSQSHPIVIFNDVSKTEMLTLLEFMYKGKVSVPKTFLPNLLKTAKNLRIRGLEHEENNSQETHSESRINVSQGINILPSVTPENKQVCNENVSGRSSTPHALNNLKQSLPLANIEQLHRLRVSISPLENSFRDRGAKVLNPFAKSQKSIEDSDSTQCEEDVALPGESKINESQEMAPVRSPNNDSDIEFIENNPSIVVINDTQNVNTSPEWYRKTVPKNRKKLRRGSKHTKSPLDDIEYTSDDSEIIHSNPKKPKKNPISDNSDLSDDKGAVLVNPLALRNKNGNKWDRENMSSGSNSPELVPLATTSERASNAKENQNQLEKEQDPSTLSDTDIIKFPFFKMGHFCVVCCKYKKNIRYHVKKYHGKCLVTTKSCKNCSRKFYLKRILKRHKCGM